MKMMCCLRFQNIQLCVGLEACSSETTEPKRNSNEKGSQRQERMKDKGSISASALNPVPDGKSCFSCLHGQTIEVSQHMIGHIQCFEA